MIATPSIPCGGVVICMSQWPLELCQLEQKLLVELSALERSKGTDKTNLDHLWLRLRGWDTANNSWLENHVCYQKMMTKSNQQVRMWKGFHPEGVWCVAVKAWRERPRNTWCREALPPGGNCRRQLRVGCIGKVSPLASAPHESKEGSKKVILPLRFCLFVFRVVVVVGGGGGEGGSFPGNWSSNSLSENENKQPHSKTRLNRQGLTHPVGSVDMPLTLISRSMSESTWGCMLSHLTVLSRLAYVQKWIFHKFSSTLLLLTWSENGGLMDLGTYKWRSCPPHWSYKNYHYWESMNSLSAPWSRSPHALRTPFSRPYTAKRQPQLGIFIYFSHTCTT